MISRKTENTKEKRIRKYYGAIRIRIRNKGRDKLL
jgi:hypothetical protein